MKEEKNNILPGSEGEQDKKENLEPQSESAPTSEPQISPEDKAAGSSEGAAAEGAPSAEQEAQPTEQPETAGAEGSAYQTSIGGSAEGQAMVSEGKPESESADSGADSDSEKPEEINPEAEIEGLTPGEETLIREAEENAEKIAEEEEAEAGETKSESRGGGKSDSQFAYYLRVGGTLTIICACIALLLAIVNAVTADKIDENRRREIEAAISAIFEDFDTTEDIKGEFSTPVTGITAVKKGEQTVGYCVFASPKGFKSSISLAVGVSASHKVRGVQVLSLSETPGVGSRVTGESFLNQFKGKTSEMTFGGSVDALAGATVSSKAVFAGVKAALDAVAAISEPVELDGEASASPETDGEASATAETDGEAAASPESDGEASASPEADGEAPEGNNGEASATNNAEGGGV